MHGFALAFLGLSLASAPVELPKDVDEVPSREFSIPLQFKNGRDEIKQVRLFYSEDEGKTWKHHDDYGPKEQLLPFKATKDGMVWFAVQLVLKDGTRAPADLKD